MYGSLKKGFFNHERFEINKGKFIKNASLDGFQMYSLGMFPAIVRTDRAEDIVHGEIWQIDMGRFLFINSIEVSTGYALGQTETEIRTGPFGLKRETVKVYLWAMTRERVKALGARLAIPGGKWERENGIVLKYLDK